MKLKNIFFAFALLIALLIGANNSADARWLRGPARMMAPRRYVRIVPRVWPAPPPMAWYPGYWPYFGPRFYWPHRYYVRYLPRRWR